jgi:hypothetical protein
MKPVSVIVSTARPIRPTLPQPTTAATVFAGWGPRLVL